MDSEEIKQRMKQLILLGKQRGYVTHAEIANSLSPPVLSQSRWSSNTHM